MQDLFIVDLFVNGGPIMIPIVLCSIIALAVFIERFRFFHQLRKNPELFVRPMKAALASRDFTGALQICRKESHPIAAILSAGIHHLDLSKNSLLDVMRQEALKQMKKVEKNAQILGTIAGITPLLGLTGTVTGMISSFKVISTIGIGNPTALAGGISQALYTTAAGLLIGIPSLVAYNWCEARIARFADQVEFYSLDLANHCGEMEVVNEKVAA